MNEKVRIRSRSFVLKFTRRPRMTINYELPRMTMNDHERPRIKKFIRSDRLRMPRIVYKSNFFIIALKCQIFTLHENKLTEPNLNEFNVFYKIIDFF